jgi:hypothetical protein
MRNGEDIPVNLAGKADDYLPGFGKTRTFQIRSIYKFIRMSI